MNHYLAPFHPQGFLNNVVIAISLRPINATLSPLFKVKYTLSNTFSPSIVLERPSTVNKSFPTSRSGVKPTNGNDEMMA